MDVRVRLSADLIQHVGKTHLTMRLSDGATVADLMSRLRNQYPSLTDRLEMAVPFVAGRHASQTEPLADGQEVAFLLPIAGGGR
ncbi:MAG: MoaD/ThiS family protein [Anaerolineae bacterium]